MPPETGTENAVIKNTELCFSLWDPKHAQYRDYRGMKENPVGISQTLDVPHVGWNAVDAFQLLRWVQNCTQTGCNEGAHQGTRDRDLWSPNARVLENNCTAYLENLLNNIFSMLPFLAR